MLDDEDTAVEQEAAEVLVRQGGRDGLLAVLSVLGRRSDDPDADYIACRLRELQIFEEIPILERARKIGKEYTCGPVHDGIGQLEDLLNSGNGQ
ncbi:hypothetical protein [Nocardia sp. R6R-6]|uniref:hypothetical protein n=1 Tax=Nocardia sp. R6R-6 TaxID=3459303 RepID=UPI00403D6ACA